MSWFLLVYVDFTAQTVRIRGRSAYSGWVLPAAKAPDGLRQVFLVEQGGVEAQQGEVQVK